MVRKVLLFIMRVGIKCCSLELNSLLSTCRQYMVVNKRLTTFHIYLADSLVVWIWHDPDSPWVFEEIKDFWCHILWEGLWIGHVDCDNGAFISCGQHLAYKNILRTAWSMLQFGGVSAQGSLSASNSKPPGAFCKKLPPTILMRVWWYVLFWLSSLLWEV